MSPDRFSASPKTLLAVAKIMETYETKTLESEPGVETPPPYSAPLPRRSCRLPTSPIRPKQRSCPRATSRGLRPSDPRGTRRAGRSPTQRPCLGRPHRRLHRRLRAVGADPADVLGSGALPDRLDTPEAGATPRPSCLLGGAAVGIRGGEPRVVRPAGAGPPRIVRAVVRSGTEINERAFLD